MAGGYAIKEAIRQPTHIEIVAERLDEFDNTVGYLFAITDANEFTDDDLVDLTKAASDGQSHLVLISRNPSNSGLSSAEVLERLGGAIPAWQALSDDYPLRLEQLARNELPQSEGGEAWRLFEDAVSDGLEFLFARRIKRLGGGKRGSRVADCICKTPDDAIILVDAKAASEGFNAANENLRALKEYATQQKRIQSGQQPLSCCLIVSSRFDQSPDRLMKTGLEFMSETGVPACFITSDTLGSMISLIASAGVRQRLAIHWRKVFVVPGLIVLDTLNAEVQRIANLQLRRT